MFFIFKRTVTFENAVYLVIIALKIFHVEYLIGSLVYDQPTKSGLLVRLFQQIGPINSSKPNLFVPRNR